MNKKIILIVVMVILILFLIGCQDVDVSAPEKETSSKGQQNTCVENWSCEDWSECTEQETQTRTCTDSNSCGTTENKPSITQSCTYDEPCIEDWDCGSWSTCTEQGKQTRTCTDSNSCGTTENKPSITQSCTYDEPCVEDWDCGSWSDCTEQETQSRTCTDLNSCGTTEDKPSTTQSCTYVEPCTEDWSCEDWSECTEQETQTRTCTDANSCGTTEDKPSTTQSCTYVEVCDNNGECERDDGETLSNCPNDCFFSDQTCKSSHTDCTSDEYPFCVLGFCASPIEPLRDFIEANYETENCGAIPCDNCYNGVFFPNIIAYGSDPIFDLYFCTECVYQSIVFICNEGYTCEMGFCVPE